MTSFPGSTFSWQSNIYTYAFIYYNLHPVPKGVGGWVRLCLSPAVPASSPTSLLVAPIIIHLHPHGSSPPRHVHHPPPSTCQQPRSHVQSSKKYYPCATFFHVTRITDWFSVLYLLGFWPHKGHMPILLFIWYGFRVMWYKILPFVYKILPFVYKILPFVVQSPPPMWYKVSSHVV